MFNPFADDEKNRNLTNQGLNVSDTEHQNGNQTQWQGDYYRYSRPTNEPPVYSWERQSVPQQSTFSFQEPRKKKRGGKKIFVKVLAGVMCCLMISAGSIAGFTALVNSGYIKFGTSTSDPAFTVTKLVNSAPTNTATVTGELTKQQIAEKVVPSVVCIQNYQLGQNARYTMGGNGAGSAGDGNAVTPTSEGSGIIATGDGYIITNAHVVDGASSLKVILSNGTKYEAKLIGSDSVTDLAVIKIDAKGLAAAEFGSSDDLKVADTVMAIGNPGGMEFNSSVTIGYVSALNREITNSETGYTMKCIQTDAAINPGNSGGALVNMYGQVVGINTTKISQTGYEGIGFAIPISTAKPYIDSIIANGYVTGRVKVGISVYALSESQAKWYNYPSGLYIDSIDKTSDAYAKGLRTKDIITQINGAGIADSDASKVYSKFYDAESKFKAGDTITVTVYRTGTGKTATVSFRLEEDKGDTDSTNSSSQNQNQNSNGYGNSDQNGNDDFFSQFTR